MEMKFEAGLGFFTEIGRDDRNAAFEHSLKNASFFTGTLSKSNFRSRNIQTDDGQTQHQQQHRDLNDSEEFSPPYLPPRKKSNENTQLWTPPFSFGLHPCVKPTPKYKEAAESDHYITVRSNGGLNQMRTGIADIVSVAHIMNATLVIPELDKRSFWQDSRSLRRDVKIIKKLPKEVESLPRARKHFTSWSSVGYYEEMTHLWKEYKLCCEPLTELTTIQVIHVAKSDSRLANNDLPIDIQRLRCRALYRGLRFSPAIESLGQANPRFGSKLVERLKSRAGRYIALHLRYEKDMLAFTGCTYGLTDAESEELRAMRESTSHWKIKSINSTEQRTEGLCPLTPKEVGIFLKGLGYPQSTVIYIAAGEIYGGDDRLSELKSRFPNLVFKEMLAAEEELKGFTGHATKTAALDYIISVESDVFVPSHSGNMARAVEGHRRFLGHRRTITPDRKGLVKLFNKVERGQLKEGAKLSSLVKQMHQARQGAPRRRKGPAQGIKGRARFRTEEAFYENPYPECICSSKDHKEP
ncbi:unnamed protein product [Thlaspi arvense]|uniref:O-fucosyltransferase family protein n=1 Tax=Thlaspi arvense TaxID=13288 RepID=A0AAU9RI32_THLAR|nr:unnamed protein product [Thlaspi arvense]